jgi:hypothetical protein
VHLYPARWQRRYGDEFLALLEHQPPSAQVWLDVVLGALDAWLRPQLGPTGRRRVVAVLDDHPRPDPWPGGPGLF